MADIKRQYNLLLAKVYDMEERGETPSQKYDILVGNLLQLYITIAKSESIFDITTFEQAVEHFREQGNYPALTLGFNVDGIEYPFCKDSDLRERLLRKADSKTENIPPIFDDRGNWYKTKH